MSKNEETKRTYHRTILVERGVEPFGTVEFGLCESSGGGAAVVSGWMKLGDHERIDVSHLVDYGTDEEDYVWEKVTGYVSWDFTQEDKNGDPLERVLDPKAEQLLAMAADAYNRLQPNCPFLYTSEAEA